MFGKEKHSEKEYAYEQDVEIAPAANREGDDMVYDAVFGEISDNGPNYRGVSGWCPRERTPQRGLAPCAVLSRTSAHH